MTDPGSPLGQSPGRDGVHLRLLWPQRHGAGTSSVRELAPEFPLDVARRGYAVGSAVLEAVLPQHIRELMTNFVQEAQFTPLL